MYEDIINLERPKSNRMPMSIENRAAQFSPFAALTGYEDSIKETGRITKEKIELDDNKKEILDFEINKIIENIKNNKELEVIIKYFHKDDKKEGGEYKEEKSFVKKVDIFNKTLILKDDKRIQIFWAQTSTPA